MGSIPPPASVHSRTLARSRPSHLAGPEPQCAQGGRYDRLNFLLKLELGVTWFWN